MKNNIVFWGADEMDRRILVAARLRAKDNKVDFWTFPEKQVNAAFAEKMFGDWEELNPAEFPDGYTFMERDISSSELLPEIIKTDNTELVMRAEKEWFVKVLVQRLYEMLEAEVNALHEQIMSLKEYDKTLWDSCKTYWDKIMQHNQERNITKDQAIELRSKVNAGFEKLKSLLDNNNRAFEEEAQSNFFQLNKRLESIKAELENNPGSSRNAFNQLRQIQQEAKNLRLSRLNRNDLFQLINDLFEASKNISRSGMNEKINHRIAGLEEAIQKMHKSLDFDLKDVEYINKRTNSSSVSQLEFKLSKAKLDMLQHKIDSKKAKLEEMNKLMQELKAESHKIVQTHTEHKSEPAKTAKEDGKRTHKPMIRSEKVEINSANMPSGEKNIEVYDKDIVVPLVSIENVSLPEEPTFPAYPIAPIAQQEEPIENPINIAPASDHFSSVALINDEISKIVISTPTKTEVIIQESLEKTIPENPLVAEAENSSPDNEVVANENGDKDGETSID